jgi:methionyl-tRNA synthetase
VRKLDEWFRTGLKDWDISRDAPYFGFQIPGEKHKYFYVWFDAPVGYMASFLNLCAKSGLSFGEFWDADSSAELYHFIGKDILYFHSLFWPAVLSGSRYRTPSGIFVHGFLTVDGQKMSKRRGTFITAATFAKHLDPDYLRYYFASKLGPGVDDIDLSFSDFVAKVNADLVGKLVNIASRCAGFVQRLNDGQLAPRLADEALFEEFAEAAGAIADDYEQRNYARGLRRVMALADRANQYIDDRKPWLTAKDPAARDDVVAVCTLGLNMFRTLMVYLKPVVPALAERAEKLLASGELVWADAAIPLLDRRIEPFEALLKRVEPETIQRIVDESRAGSTAAPAAPAPATDDAQIDLQYFQKVDLRVAKVVQASLVDGADKLLRLHLDVDGEERVVFAGIRSEYEPAALVGKLVVLVANLKERKMRFGVSQGMVLAASGKGGGVFLLHPDDGARPGMKVS